MSEDSKPSSPVPPRFDYETERKKIAATQVPEPDEGVHWDKPAPTENPAVAPRQIPKHLDKVVKFFNGIILDESLVLDLCFERCMGIIKQNVESKLVGMDNFQGESGMMFTPAHYASIAGPITVELYRQVLKSIEGREKEYMEIVEEARRELERTTPAKTKIFVP